MRQVCVVDHVEIFPKSTSGWVRVKGFEHFKAAFGTIFPKPPPPSPGMKAVPGDEHGFLSFSESDSRCLQSCSMAKSSKVGR